jgi:phosphopantothenoylcysteine decarboxylase/phosphopantothenate--cysteine ligase
MLKNKNILVGITGSIAAYKACDLVRLFVKGGANVKVVLTSGAMQFITPLTYEALTGDEVLYAQTESWANGCNHIDMANWAHLFVIAPATANSINKIAWGIADNLLLQTLLAYDGKVLIAPAANTKMIQNTSTQKSIQTLKQRGFSFVDTQTKLLACKTKGDGALADVEDIYAQSIKELNKESFWVGKEVIITGGGTIEAVDDVRFISNFSSGKMAVSLAEAAYYKGANVTFISTKNFPKLPSQINFISATTTKQMQNALEDCIKSSNNPYVFMAAAVSDFIPQKQSGKIKKENKKTLDLSLHKNIDILKNLDKSKGKFIGFKAELDKNNALTNAKTMLQNKNLNAVCLNVLEAQNNFGSEKNEITFITRDKEEKLQLDTKLNVSLKILGHASKLA